MDGRRNKTTNICNLSLMERPWLLVMLRNDLDKDGPGHCRGSYQNMPPWHADNFELKITEVQMLQMSFLPPP